MKYIIISMSKILYSGQIKCFWKIDPLLGSKGCDHFGKQLGCLKTHLTCDLAILFSITQRNENLRLYNYTYMFVADL